MKEFLVECPKCKSLATVTTNKSDDTSNDKLVCNNCNHIEKADELKRYIAIINRACDNCGQKIEITISNNKEKVEEFTIPCPHCGIVRTYKPRNEAYKLIYKHSGICDPIFNLPLWFQADIKGDTFWAYNREHLREIRNYVAAKLRERQTTTHMTMVERLPNFIKVAKNRDTILKVIDKLINKNSTQH
jgi:DNA-directed RNA polymerase subunit RPC12/RpoP